MKSENIPHERTSLERLEELGDKETLTSEEEREMKELIERLEPLEEAVMRG